MRLRHLFLCTCLVTLPVTAQADPNIIWNPATTAAPAQATVNCGDIPPGCDQALAQQQCQLQQQAVQAAFNTVYRPAPQPLGQLSCLSSFLQAGMTPMLQFPSLTSILQQLEQRACSALNTMWQNTAGAVGGGTGMSATLDIMGINLGGVSLTPTSSAPNNFANGFVGTVNGAVNSFNNTATSAANSMFGTAPANPPPPPQ